MSCMSAFDFQVILMPIKFRVTASSVLLNAKYCFLGLSQIDG